MHVCYEDSFIPSIALYSIARETMNLNCLTSNFKKLIFSCSNGLKIPSPMPFVPKCNISSNTNMTKNCITCCIQRYYAGIEQIIFLYTRFALSTSVNQTCTRVKKSSARDSKVYFFKQNRTQYWGLVCFDDLPHQPKDEHFAPLGLE